MYVTFLHSVYRIQMKACLLWIICRIQMKACLLWIICCGIVMESSSHTSVRHTQTCRTPVHTQLGEVDQSLPGCVLCNIVCCSLFPVPSLFCLSDFCLCSVQGNYVVPFCQIQCPVSGVPGKAA